MQHMVLMKFQPGTFTPAVAEDIRAGYKEIQKELADKILSVQVSENCVVRDQNMDLLIQLNLQSKDVLQTYLKHPRHVALIQKHQPNIISLVSFDREEA